jgi:NADPH:quinone reductase-like Zn-dependent oxidoreductase
MGLRVITTAAGRNAEWVRALWAEINIDSICESVSERIAAITCGAGVDAIVDTVGPVTATEGLEMLAYGGGIACVAGLPDFSEMKSFGNALSVHDIALGGLSRRG